VFIGTASAEAYNSWPIQKIDRVGRREMETLLGSPSVPFLFR
jgi:hypothetical protein